jgi:hypothetical protein
LSLRLHTLSLSEPSTAGRWPRPFERRQCSVPTSHKNPERAIATGPIGRSSPPEQQSRSVAGCRARRATVQASKEGLTQRSGTGICHRHRHRGRSSRTSRSLGVRWARAVPCPCDLRLERHGSSPEKKKTTADDGRTVAATCGRQASRRIASRLTGRASAQRAKPLLLRPPAQEPPRPP